jgi:hypothetical protein
MPPRTALENRLVLATGLWRKVIGGPLPKVPKGEPAAQIEALELVVVDAVCGQATAEDARAAAAQTWDLGHDRPDDDPVKRRVVEWHHKLAELSKPTFG